MATRSEAGTTDRSEASCTPLSMRKVAEAQLIHLACSKAPDGRQRWTLELLADRMVKLEYVEHISPETVRQALKKTS